MLLVAALPVDPSMCVVVVVAVVDVPSTINCKFPVKLVDCFGVKYLFE